MSKFVNLEQIKVLANKVKSEDAALGTKLETVTTKVDNLVAAGGEANILEGVKVNGAALAISDKMVDILIASGEEKPQSAITPRTFPAKGSPQAMSTVDAPMETPPSSSGASLPRRSAHQCAQVCTSRRSRTPKVMNFPSDSPCARSSTNRRFSPCER